MKPFQRPHPPPGRSLWLAPLVAWALVTTIALQWSHQFGRLSIPATFDDVSYLGSAARSVTVLRDGGPAKLLVHLWHNPPHSPMLWAMGLIGFLVGGVRDWAAYVVHSVVLLVVLCAVAWFTRQGKLWERIASVAFFALLPASWLTVQELRPDAAAAFFAAISCVLMIERVPKRGARLWVVSGLLALSLLAKPVVFPATISLFGFSCVLAIALAWMSRTRPGAKAAAARITVLRCLRVFLLAAVLVAPYFVVGGSHVVAYIKSVLFSPQTEVWSLQTSAYTFRQHLGYYFQRGAGFMGRGPLQIVLATAGLCVWILVVRGDRRARLRACAAAALILAAFSIVVMNRVKSPFFGLTFYSFLLVGTAAGLGQILKLAALRTSMAFGVRFIVVGATIGAVALFRMPASPVIIVTPEMRASAATLNMIVDAIVEESSGGIVFLPTTGFLNAESLMYEADKRGVAIIATSQVFEKDRAIYEAAFDRAEMVVIPEPGTDLVAPIFPAGKALPQIWTWIQERPDFSVKRTWELASGGRVLLYVRARAPA